MSQLRLTRAVALAAAGKATTASEAATSTRRTSGAYSIQGNGQ